MAEKLNQDFFMTCVNGDLEAVREQLDKGADITWRSPHRGMDHGTVLHFTAKSGNVQVMNTLLKTRSVNIDVTNDNGRTPLHEAAENDHWDMLQVLIEKTASPHIKDVDGNIPLDLTTNPICIKILKDAMLNIPEPTENPENAGNSRLSDAQLSQVSQTTENSQLLKHIEVSPTTVNPQITGSVDNTHISQPVENQIISNTQKEEKQRRIELFDNALKEGYITSKWTKLCVLGPPGSGKSALLRLLAPNKLHCSPTAKSISDSSVQTTLDNDKQEHRIQQHVIIAKVEGKKHVWYLADINSIKLKVAEAIKKHSDFEDSLVEGHSKDVKGCSIYDEILEMLPYVEKSSELDETHFIYAFNSGSQAGVLDLATALLRSRSVNIVAIKLNEKLASRDEFFYTTDEEEMVGIGASNLQLLKDAFRCQASIPLPNLPDIKEFKPSGSERRFFVAATYSGRIQDSIALGETFDDKNKCLQKDLGNYEEVIIPYNSEKNEMIFPINATSIGDEEVRIAELIRSNAALVYSQGKVPIRWFLFQLELYKLKLKVVTITQCHQIGKSLKMTEEDVKAALLYFHDLTVCFYFPSVLENVVFIHPQILFDKLSQIIAIGSGSLSPPTLTMRTHTNLKQKAILQSALFEIISDGFEDGVFTAEDFLKLMTHLLVIAKLNDKDQYFIPCVLPTTDSPDKSFFGEVEPLIFTWDNEPISQGLFVVLIGYLLNRSPHPFEVIGKVSQFRNAIQLVFKQLGDSSG